LGQPRHLTKYETGREGTHVVELTRQDVTRLVSAHGGAVLVVDGLPDYHVDGCPRLPDRGPEEADVLDARADGFRPCRTCNPNRVLAEEAQAELAARESRSRPPALPAVRPQRPAAALTPPPPRPPASPPPYVQQQWAPVGKQFVFDGGAATYVGTAVLAFFIFVASLGFAYPFALVLRERWRAKHSLINGQRLAFNGTATGLFGLWIKWFLLSLITFGIYLFWVGPRIAQWKWQHTGFENQVVVRPAH